MMILQQTRGALSSGDQLALDLPFAATKSLAARIGPTPTFTRASGATYVGSDGLIHGIDTSTSSNSISIASKSFTLTATAGQDQLWRTGDAVEAANGVNSMVGMVTSYTPSTQVLVCNITSVTGSGTFTSWRIGYRGPRFDHDPANPTICRGLLIEEGRTNLMPQSENFASGWFITGGSISSVANAEPDGSVNSELFTEDNLNSTHRTFQSFTGTSGTVYTLSVFLKFTGRQYVYLENRSITGNPFVVFDIQNGSVFSNLSSGTLTPNIQEYPNDWYRCSVTGTVNVAGGNYNYLIGGYSAGQQSYIGSGGPAFYAWGAQVEAGSFATSYIPTTTGTLARAADTCSITNTSSFWNSSEFTLLTNANWAAAGFDSYASNFNITSGFFGARRPNINQAIAIIRSSGVNADISFGANGSFTTGSMRMALAHSTNQQAGSLNGATAIQQNSAFVPSSNPPLNIGYSGTGAYINGHVLAIRYYKKRLPNAKLQALTA